MVWLKFRRTRFPVRQGQTLIGRSPYCSLVISNGQVSREHAVLVLTGSEVEIEDLDSANGTFVNEERIEGKRTLKVGDRLRIGTEFIEVVEPGQDRSSRAVTTSGQRGSEDDAVTAPEGDPLDFVESLVSAAADSGRAAALAPAIQEAIDQMLLRHRAGRRPLDAPSAIRVAACAVRVASWFPDGSRDGWRDAVERALGGFSLRLSVGPSAD